MHIDSIRIVNYRAFADTGWIRLGRSRNIIIGRNNSGKSAFLEAFGLSRCPNVPFMSGTQGAEHSEFQLVISLDPDDIWEALTRKDHNTAIYFPFPRDLKIEMNREEIQSSEYLFGKQSPKTITQQKYIERLLTSEKILIPLSVQASGKASFVAAPPDHVEYGKQPYESVNVSMSRSRQIKVNERTVITVRASEQTPNFQNILLPLLEDSVFVFRAQRNVGSLRAFERSEYINEDASNLPVSLLTMQGERPDDFDQLKVYAKSVISDISNLSVVPLLDGNVQIQIWSQSTTGNNLPLPLADCGTGVGQILAILFAAMNSKSNIIVIDEPNSFLHPGAAKALLRILGNFPNQYIFSTHSTELILSSRPDTIHMVTRSDGASSLQELDPSEVESNRSMLRELGVSLSDVMGYEHVVWVEGETEQEAFPKLLVGTSQHTIPAFIAVKHTGDFAKKTIKRETVYDIYERLSSVSCLMPANTKFSFDREDLSDSEISDLERKSHGRAVFLRRRCFENYLISSAAIYSVLQAELKGDISFSEQDIEDFIRQDRGAQPERDWIVTLDAPNLLRNMFANFTEARLEFRKVRHSNMLLDFLQRHDSAAITELIEHVLVVSRN